MSLKTMSLNVFSKDQEPWWQRVNLTACVNADYSNLENQTGDKDMSIFFSYGSMISYDSQAFKNRAGFAFKKAKLLEGKELKDYYLGVYKLEGYELSFSKDSGNGTGFATIVRSDPGSYVLLGCHAIPNKLLAKGGNLLISEGTLNHDYYNPNNHYILMPLTEKVININSGHSFEPFNGYIFVASAHHIRKGIPANEPYKETIVHDMEGLISHGFNITHNYIEWIKSK